MEGKITLILFVDIAGVNGRNSNELCLGGKPGTGKLYTIYGFVHTSGCTVDGLGAMAVYNQLHVYYV